MSDYTKITIDSYNKTADQFFEKVNSFEILPEIYEFMKLISPQGKVLDLGCGPGHHSKIFMENGFEVVGIDLSEKMIEIAKTTVKNVDFQVMDIMNLNFPHNYFDGIWASASLIHIPKIIISQALLNLKMILNRKGLIYISVKEGNGEELITDERYGGVKKFYAYYERKEIEKLLVQRDFKILKEKIRERRITYDTNDWIYLICKNK